MAEPSFEKREKSLIAAFIFYKEELKDYFNINSIRRGQENEGGILYGFLFAEKNIFDSCHVY